MKNTALLLMDIQESFKVGDRWARRGNPDFEQNVTRLLDLWREANFAIDATQTFPIRNRFTGEEISTEALVERTEYVLRDRFARIVKARDLVSETKEALRSTP